ncbi:hypothetical protein HAX54_044502 [Datura stramonium]|uniref:Uncharacterized protein n=1 Tax=Datura stramonium TaxID=4076 RepID=A0ABS8SPJ7_DATST|nr:hypothetical protein [Datura stramonium]
MGKTEVRKRVAEEDIKAYGTRNRWESKTQWCKDGDKDLRREKVEMKWESGRTNRASATGFVWLCIDQLV